MSRGRLRSIEVATVFGPFLDAQNLAEAQNRTKYRFVDALSSGMDRRAQLWKKYGVVGRGRVIFEDFLPEDIGLRYRCFPLNKGWG